MSEGQHVYQAISEVMAELAKEGLGKDRKNDSQGYKFRGIDDVFNTLSTKLAKASLLVLPSYSGHLVSNAGQTAKGAPIYRATLVGQFSFVSVKDGSQVTCSFPGEAFDSADKATNKAMSAAYKYAALQVFCIPTEGDNDADATHLEVEHPQPPKASASKPQASASPKPTQNSSSVSPAEPKDKNNYKRQIETASSIEDLLTIANALKTEPDAVRLNKDIRQAYREKELELQKAA